MRDKTLRELERCFNDLGGDEALLRIVAAVFNRSHGTPQSLFFEQVERATLSLAEEDFTAMACHRTSDWGPTRIMEEWGKGPHSKPLRAMVPWRLLSTLIRPEAGTPAEAVREELVLWALGHGDPIRKRVEARMREAADG